MPNDNFDDEFNRIAAAINPRRYQKRELERSVGPVLDNAVRLIQEAAESREDLAVLPEDPEGDTQSLLLALSDEDVVPLTTIWLRASADGLILWTEGFPTGRVRAVSKRHYNVASEELTIDWVRRTLANIASELQIS